MDTWRTEWIEKKRQIAISLNAGDCGGTYGEAVIILCATLSALAADAWKGKGIDRVRFVELIADISPLSLESTKISIPLLVDYLRNEGRDEERKCIESSFLNYGLTHILIGDNIDRSETEILTVCNTLSSKELRKHSYANLLYKEIRSGYAHEYRPGECAESWPQTGKVARVSYVNWLDDNKPQRRIHFHVDWVANLAVETAKVVDSIAASLPRERPSSWWIDG
jgi:hypothetical protein